MRCTDEAGCETISAIGGDHPVQSSLVPFEPCHGGVKQRIFGQPIPVMEAMLFQADTAAGSAKPARAGGQQQRVQAATVTTSRDKLRKEK